MWEGTQEVEEVGEEEEEVGEEEEEQVEEEEEEEEASLKHTTAFASSMKKKVCLYTCTLHGWKGSST